jgi:Acetyltransferase (GNAT) domain
MRALLREPAPCRTSVLSGKSCSVATVALRLRPMAEEDLPAVVQAWLRLSHVARWWTPGTTAEEQVARYRRRISRDNCPATVMLTVMQGRDPTGWCQWYRWADYPAQAAAMGPPRRPASGPVTSSG